MKLTEMKLTVRTLITVLSIVLVTSLLTAAVCKLGDKSVEALETEISELKNTNQSLVDENQSLKNKLKINSQNDQTNDALNKELTDLRNKNQVLLSENQSLKNNVASFEEKNKRFNALFDKLYAELKECKAINK
ncbi:MAG: hypothetical protein IIZ03_05435 [Succinivibrionaceae bacterium]|jgi:septal ring factor EnvC (AmiA/AmiB activator)|nr:hypothetical protein [Succinivibrionaceae bacterium]